MLLLRENDDKERRGDDRNQTLDISVHGQRLEPEAMPCPYVSECLISNHGYRES